jgi:hypothetical protein
LGDDAMKRVFLILIAAFALVATHSSNRFFALLGTARAGDATVTLTNYSCTTTQGQINLCFNPKTFAPESCTATGALVIPFTVANTGQLIGDSAGNSCETDVAGYFDPGDPAPSTSQVQYSANKPIDFNPATQTGDDTFTTWTGPGKCKGATFVPGKGAKVLNTGISHFVVSSKGSRVDFIIRSFTNVPKGTNGAFLLTGTCLTQ